MSYQPWQELRGRTESVLGRWQVATAGAMLVGLLGGIVTEKRPSTALLLCVAMAGVLGLAMLGERAFPWGVVLVAVLPWYPLLGSGAEAPIVRQKVLCAAIAAAPLAPWLWSLALGGRRTRPHRGTLLIGVLYLGMTILIYETLHSISALINSQIVGFLFIGVTFLCARRFGNGRGWLASALGGLLILLLFGLYAYVSAPAARVGYFVGYPITYGALVVGLAPAALLFVYYRSRLLASGLGAFAGVMLIFSESRSSWIAVTVMVIAIVLVQARAGNFRALAAVSTIVVVLAALVVGTGSLHHIVEEKLSSKISSTDSVTHRKWSYGYGFETIGERPLLGAGYPGYSALESANKTSIGALDNGYLSISVDLGLLGLIAAAIPIAVALRILGLCLRLGLTPRYELALALGILGMASVTMFYDSFYWAQIDLLLGAMGGVLSTRIDHVSASEPASGRRARRPRRGRRQIGDLRRLRERPLGSAGSS